MTYLLTERIPIEKALYVFEMPFSEARAFMKRCDNDEARKVQFNKNRRVCNEIIVGNGEVVREYDYSESMEHGGRLYSSKGIQTVMAEFRGFLMSHTTDIDIVNCHPTLLSYICRKHHIACPHLDYYNGNRETVLGSDPRRSRDEVKRAMLISINSDRPANKNEKNKFIKDFVSEIARIQTELLAVAEFTAIFDTMPKSRTDNIAGSKLNRVLCTYEDYMLREAVQCLQVAGLEVAVQMFDGVMVYGDHYGDGQLLHQLNQLCESKYPGCNIQWSFKKHLAVVAPPVGWKSKKLMKLMNEITPRTPEELAAKALEDNKEGVMDGDDAGAAAVVLKHYPHWVCCDKILYVYDDTSGIWTDNIHVQNRIISRLEGHLDILKNTKDGVEYTGRNYARCNHKRKEIYGYINENSVDDDWAMRTESSSLGKVLFKNGHYDFRRQLFVAGRVLVVGDDQENGFDPTIVFAHRVDYDYVALSGDDMAYAETIRERLFTQALGEDVGDYLIRNLARGFAGDTMKRIMFGLGMTNSGKGMLTKACQMSMGAYCGTFTAENLAINISLNDEGQKMRWAYLLRHKRLIISNEISNTRPLNGTLINKLSSGGVDQIPARLHGGNETTFIPHYLCIVLANDIPKIEPCDGAFRGRARVYTYTKSFVEHPANEFELQRDPNLSREMETLRFQRCFLGLLFASYAKFESGGRLEVEPAEVAEAFGDWIGTKEDNDVMALFQEQFEFTNEKADFVKSKDIEAWVCRARQSSYRKFIMELKKHASMRKFCEVKNGLKKLGKTPVQCWFGIRAVTEFEGGYCDLDLVEE